MAGPKRSEAPLKGERVAFHEIFDVQTPLLRAAHAVEAELVPELRIAVLTHRAAPTGSRVHLHEGPGTCDAHTPAAVSAATLPAAETVRSPLVAAQRAARPTRRRSRTEPPQTFAVGSRPNTAPATDAAATDAAATSATAAAANTTAASPTAADEGTHPPLAQPAAAAVLPACSHADELGLSSAGVQGDSTDGAVESALEGASWESGSYGDEELGCIVRHATICHRRESAYAARVAAAVAAAAPVISEAAGAVAAPLGAHPLHPSPPRGGGMGWLMGRRRRVC